MVLNVAFLLQQSECFPLDSLYFDLFYDFENETLKIFNNVTEVKQCNSYSCFVISINIIKIEKCFSFNNLIKTIKGDIYKSQMNLSADPCDDFYKFSCGNFLDRNYNTPSGVLEKLHIDFLRLTDGYKKTI